MKVKEKKLKKKSLFDRIEREYNKFKRRWLKSNNNEEVKRDQSGRSIRGR